MRSLDPCPKCHTGTMRRQSTRTVGRWRTRYFRCDACGHHGKASNAVDERGRDIFDAVIRTDKSVLECPHCHHTIEASHPSRS
ncbi:hypothetical protein V7x_24630 [Crateriforma conspicua]|uniref:Uncharacterized protein n=1 Tax=Crateriforma conspicua TaxID=2527996 RepID=A0A5C6FUY8_9PLAN|nr:hypothetical protein V7x_24630 [Crateriforma conspicua]